MSVRVCKINATTLSFIQYIQVQVTKTFSMRKLHTEFEGSSGVKARNKVLIGNKVLSVKEKCNSHILSTQTIYALNVLNIGL